MKNFGDMTEDEFAIYMKGARRMNRLADICLVAAHIYGLWIIALFIFACVCIFTPWWVEGITLAFILTLWSAVPMIPYWVIESIVSYRNKRKRNASQ